MKSNWILPMMVFALSVITSIHGAPQASAQEGNIIMNSTDAKGDDAKGEEGKGDEEGKGKPDGNVIIPKPPTVPSTGPESAAAFALIAGAAFVTWKVTAKSRAFTA